MNRVDAMNARARLALLHRLLWPLLRLKKILSFPLDWLLAARQRFLQWYFRNESLLWRAEEEEMFSFWRKGGEGRP